MLCSLRYALSLSLYALHSLSLSLSLSPSPPLVCASHYLCFYRSDFRRSNAGRRAANEDVARFASGDLQEFATYPAPAEKDKTVQVCRYAGGKLLTPPPADCPSYDAMKGGIKVSASEPQVPSARDPRK